MPSIVIRHLEKGAGEEVPPGNDQWTGRGFMPPALHAPGRCPPSTPPSRPARQYRAMQGSVKAAGAALAAALVGILLAAGCAGPAPARDAAARFQLGGLPMTSCYVGIAVAAQCGVLNVAENPAAPEGRRID